MFEVKMPDFLKEGRVIKWRKREGDKVKEGEILLDIATEKATVEYHATQDGILNIREKPPMLFYFL